MILSVDTGLKNFGISIFGPTGTCEHVQLITTQKSKNKKLRVADDMSNRVVHITKQLNDLFHMYPIFEVIGELPTFGAQSSAAAVSMTAGATIILTLCGLRDIQPFWISPSMVKEYFTGDKEASKQTIMDRCCKLYNWNITYREVKTKYRIRKDASYHVLGKKYGAGKFEHIADSIAAYHSYIKIKEINLI